jgi:hypothetical protein
MSRRNRRSQRLLVAGLVAALLVGPLAGFVVARAVEDNAPNGRITAAGPGDVGVADAPSWSQTVVGGPGRLEPLFRRTTDDGITIRGFRTPVTATPCPGDGGGIVGQLSTEEAVGIASGPRSGEVRALEIKGNGVFGANGEGSPARWAIAQVDGGVARVRVEYGGGGSDEMEPVDGIVILAARTDLAEQSMSVSGYDRDGRRRFSVAGDGPIGGPAVVTTTTLAPRHPPAPGSDDVADRCLPPPPSLPAPGGQPDDPVAARAAIERTFLIAYDGGLGDTQEKRNLVEDSESLVGVMDEIRNGPYASQVSQGTAQVREIVFVSPTEATVRYDILVGGATNFADRVGRAVLIDGTWKIARSTVCTDISLAGASCPPPR